MSKQIELSLESIQLITKMDIRPEPLFWILAAILSQSLDFDSEYKLLAWDECELNLNF
jgi:hypothetical protein